MQTSFARRKSISPWLSGIPTIWWRRLALFLGAVAALYLLRKGFRGIWKINDFDVIRHGAVEVWHRSAALYESASREGRHFLYPPTGAIALIPLAWLPYHLGGVLFTLLRMVALAVLLRVGIVWSQEADWLRNRYRIPWLVIGAVAVCWRFLVSEFGNGQINILLAAFCLGGLWAAFRPASRWQWVGGFLMGLAAAIKVAPLLFFGVLVLHRRWRALAGGVLCIVTLIAATRLMYAPDLIGEIWHGWSIQADGMALSAIDTDRVISVPELVVSLAATGGSALTPQEVRSWWLIEAITLGVLFLLIRLVRHRTAGVVPPLWDAAMFSIGVLMLSPLVRKAHLVLALFPILIALVLVFGRDDLRQSRLMQWLLCAAAILFLSGLSLPFEWLMPGRSVNPALFLALLFSAASLSCARFPSSRINGS